MFLFFFFSSHRSPNFCPFILLFLFFFSFWFYSLCWLLVLVVIRYSIFCYFFLYRIKLEWNRRTLYFYDEEIIRRYRHISTPSPSPLHTTNCLTIVYNIELRKTKSLGNSSNRERERKRLKSERITENRNRVPWEEWKRVQVKKCG